VVVVPVPAASAFAAGGLFGVTAVVVVETATGTVATVVLVAVARVPFEAAVAAAAPVTTKAIVKIEMARATPGRGMDLWPLVSLTVISIGTVRRTGCRGPGSLRRRRCCAVALVTTKAIVTRTPTRAMPCRGTDLGPLVSLTVILIGTISGNL
jgi:hypothetical protein